MTTDHEQEVRTDGGQPLDREHYEFLSNAGRCDICGSTVEMSQDDILAIMEFGVSEKITEEHGTTDQDAADAVARALERVGDSGADYDLAETIREQLAMKVHNSCLEEKTEFDKLTVEPERVEEMVDDD